MDATPLAVLVLPQAVSRPRPPTTSIPMTARCRLPGRGSADCLAPRLPRNDNPLVVLRPSPPRRAIFRPLGLGLQKHKPVVPRRLEREGNRQVALSFSTIPTIHTRPSSRLNRLAVGKRLTSHLRFFSCYAVLRTFG